MKLNPSDYEQIKIKGAIQMLESVIEIAEEEGENAIQIDDLKDLLETYRKRVKS